MARKSKQTPEEVPVQAPQETTATDPKGPKKTIRPDGIVVVDY